MEGKKIRIRKTECSYVQKIFRKARIAVWVVKSPTKRRPFWFCNAAQATKHHTTKEQQQFTSSHLPFKFKATVWHTHTHTHVTCGYGFGWEAKTCRDWHLNACEICRQAWAVFLITRASGDRFKTTDSSGRQWRCSIVMINSIQNVAKIITVGCLVIA